MQRRWIAYAWIGLGSSCVPTQPTQPQGPSAGLLELALPAGVDVAVDGEARGTTPLGRLELPAGAHAVTLTTACAKAEVEVSIDGGQTRRLQRSDAPALGFATLRATARGLDGKALPHTLLVDEQETGEGPYRELTLSACPHRIDVKSEGLGAWTEERTYAADEVITREIVLTEGSDMVRLPGGNYRMGPPGPDRYIDGYQPTEDDTEEEREGWRWVHTLEVELAPFDIDRTEVTAAQFYACRQSGRCAWDALRLGYTEFPKMREQPYCTTSVQKDRTPIEGRADHPMNCIARWEAATYCEAMGKRLPTDAEWEYAARGGRQDYYCPWGEATTQDEYGRGSCVKARRYEPTEPVCSHPDENSPHGLCDMVGNVMEFVGWTKGRHTAPEFAEQPDFNGVVSIVVRGAWGPVFVDSFSSQQQESADVGFRCVRNTKPQGGRDGD